MRRIIILTVLLLVTTSCGDTADGTTSTAAATPRTTAAVATTAAVPTTEAPTTTSVPADSLTFDPPPATPPAVFETFTASITMEMALDDVTLEMSGNGTWTTDAFECTVVTGLGSIKLAQSLVATPETLWLDSGNGFEPTPLSSKAAQDAIGMCPTSPLFWVDFAAEDLGGRPVGETVSFGGRDAVKTDLADALGAMSGVGIIPGFEDAIVNEMAMWIDSETNVVLGLEADIEIDGSFMAEVGGPAAAGNAIGVTMSISVERVNDPALAIDLP